MNTISAEIERRIVDESEYLKATLTGIDNFFGLLEVV